MSLAAWSLVWMRCSGFLAAFPQAVGLAVPVPVLGLTAAALALALAPLAHAPHAPGLGLGQALGEAVLGAALGFCLRLPLLAVEAAGQAVGFTTTASSFLMQDIPGQSGGGNLWASAYLQVGLLVYLAAGGPQAVVEALAGSLRLAPPGALAMPQGLAVGDLAALLVRLSAFTALMCLPPVLASLAAQWGLGLVFRASARIQLHTFALPLASLAAVGVLALSLPTWPSMLQRSMGWSLQAAAGLSAAAGGRP